MESGRFLSVVVFIATQESRTPYGIFVYGALNAIVQPAVPAEILEEAGVCWPLQYAVQGAPRQSFLQIPWSRTWRGRVLSPLNRNVWWFLMESRVPMKAEAGRPEKSERSIENCLKCGQGAISCFLRDSTRRRVAIFCWRHLRNARDGTGCGPGDRGP